MFAVEIIGSRNSTQRLSFEERSHANITMPLYELTSVQTTRPFRAAIFEFTAPIHIEQAMDRDYRVNTTLLNTTFK
jgi:hypothetical protein